MSCKICGAVIIVSSPGSGMIITSPTCTCGKIRNRVRKQGCPICKIHTLIQLTKEEDGFLANCPNCGTEWAVTADAVRKINTHYDMIPSSFFAGTVLDVGCGDGTNQQKSTNWPHIYKCIEEDRYIGLDIMPAGLTFPAIVSDLFDCTIEQSFDAVLAIHVIEHIERERWPELFKKLKSWVKEEGWLVVGAPYKGSAAKYANFQGPENQRHRVFDIDEAHMLMFLDTIELTKYQGPYSESFICYWQKEKE